MEHTEARNPEDLDGVAEKLCRFAPGDVICREGEPCDFAYLIRTGEIELRILGRPRRLVRGALFGEQAILEDALSVGTAIATRGSELIRLAPDELLDMIRERSELATGFFHALALRPSLPLHHPPADNEVIRRIAGQLLVRMDTELDPPRARTSLRELAEACAVDLPTAHRSLAALFDRKVLYLVEDELFVPDVAALEALQD